MSSGYISPTDNLISFRRDQPRNSTEPLLRTSMATVKSASLGLSGRDSLLVGLATVFLALIGLLYLLQAADITGIAYRSHDLAAEVARIEHENSALRIEVAQMEGLERVERRAEELGFEKARQVRYLVLEDGSGAEGREMPASPESGE